MEQIYVVFIGATRSTFLPHGIQTETTGNLFMIAAADTDEIYYMANQIAMQRWPVQDGWGAKYYVQPAKLSDLQNLRIVTRADFP